MDWGSEKAEGLGHDWASASDVLDAMAVASVLVTLAGSIATVAASSAWPPFAYFSIAAALFDLLFTIEYFTACASSGRFGNPLKALSSVIPLLLVSGPFIAGAAHGDLGAASVRGFWLAAPPINALATIASLRLLRAARIPHAKAGSAGAGPLLVAASAGLAIVLAGAVAIDAFSLPGASTLARARRGQAAIAIDSSPDRAAKAIEARSVGAIAATDDGIAILAAPLGTYPGDVAIAGSGRVVAWFPVVEEAKARALASALVSFAALAAAIFYRLASTRLGSSSRRRVARSASIRSGHRPAAMPTGDEELAGILGKRSR